MSATARAAAAVVLSPIPSPNDLCSGGESSSAFSATVTDDQDLKSLFHSSKSVLSMLDGILHFRYGANFRRTTPMVKEVVQEAGAKAVQTKISFSSLLECSNMLTRNVVPIRSRISHLRSQIDWGNMEYLSRRELRTMSHMWGRRSNHKISFSLLVPFSMTSSILSSLLQNGLKYLQPPQ